MDRIGTDIAWWRRNLASMAAWLLILCEFAGVCVRTPTPNFASNTMQNLTVIRGEDVDLRCKVDNLGQFMVAFLKADDPPRLISYDETVFRQTDKYELKKLDSQGEDEWLLIIKNIQEADAGAYTCQVSTNPVIKKTAYVQIKVPPLVSRSSTPSAVEVREGHNVSLSCEASGNPLPRVIWRRQDRQLIRFNGANGFGATVYNGSELFLQRVSRKHMSEYVCVASNGIPPDESWTVKLHVTFEPVVIPQSTTVEARQGSLVRLICNVEAWPRAMVSWFFNNVEIFDPIKYTTEQSVSDRYKSVHMLEIRYVEKNQFGNYRCVAANDYGKNFADIRLIEAPPLLMSSILLTEGSGNSQTTDTESASIGKVDSPDDEDNLKGVSKNDPELNVYLKRPKNEEQDIKELDQEEEVSTTGLIKELRLNDQVSSAQQRRPLRQLLIVVIATLFGAFKLQQTFAN